MPKKLRAFPITSKMVDNYVREIMDFVVKPFKEAVKPRELAEDAKAFMTSDFKKGKRRNINASITRGNSKYHNPRRKKK